KNVAERLIVRSHSSLLTLVDLPDEIRHSSRPAVHAPAPRAAEPTAASSSVADELYDRMVTYRESFWHAVHPAFMSRDLTRADLRRLLRKGLQQTGGNYKVLDQMFNMPASDYKRFLNFLRKHECHVAFQRFRIARPMADGIELSNHEDVYSPWRSTKYVTRLTFVFR